MSQGIKKSVRVISRNILKRDKQVVIGKNESIKCGIRIPFKNHPY